MVPDLARDPDQLKSDTALFETSLTIGHAAKAREYAEWCASPRGLASGP